MNDIQTAITFPAEQYVERSVYPHVATNADTWADTFRSLGGFSCHVRAGWQTGTGDDTATAIVTGTADAIDFVIAGLLA